MNAHPSDPANPGAAGDAAQLSSVATALDDLTTRVAQAADRLRRNQNEAAAADLDEVERSLRAAARRLATTVRAMSGGGRSKDT
jgi:hypothetical protein